MASTPCIAYQGQPGAYSHLACMDVYPKLEPVPCESFEEAFRAVEEGHCQLAMIPIENSLGGRVADIHHLLPESSLYIVGEHFQPVKHCLLAPPGATLEGLKTVSSHTQALAQCRRLIRELGLTTIVCSDTAGAARELAERGDPSEAAIASRLAAEVYGLTVVRTRIEDRLGNTTRFVVMSRRREEPDPRAGASMTSLVFQVRSVPGALYKALGGFATNGHKHYQGRELHHRLELHRRPVLRRDRGPPLGSQRRQRLRGTPVLLHDDSGARYLSAPPLPGRLARSSQSVKFAG